MPKRDDWLHYLLVEWGEWFGRSLGGLGFAGATIEARCMEYGTDGQRSGNGFGPIVPYYWPSHRIRQVHSQILGLSDVDRGALIVRYVDQVNEDAAAARLEVSPRAYWYRVQAAKGRLRKALARPTEREAAAVEN
ncbi:MAG TPA: hypothetical protein VK973_10645 [Arenicellales bacterium]|nr:hypothetical protein [Arenicellales bacterium]